MGVLVNTNGQYYYQSDEYRVKAYPEINSKTEAYKLLSNARDMIFGMAEDNIGIPPYVFNKDNTGYIGSREEAVETVLNERQRRYEKEAATPASLPKP